MAAAALVAVNPAGWQWSSRLFSFASAREASATAVGALAGAPAAEDDREIPVLARTHGSHLHVGPAGRVAHGHGPRPGVRGRGPGTCRRARSGSTRASCRASASAASPSPGAASGRPSAPSATLAHNDRQIAWVNTKYDGWIENVAVNYLGETVEEGQVLFDIYSPRLVTTQMAVPAGGRLRGAARDLGVPGDRRARAPRSSRRRARGSATGTSPTSRSRRWSASGRRVAPCRSCLRSPASSSRRWIRPSTGCTSRRA